MLAGELGNRWPFAHANGREESPDTSSAQAEKGNAPGNARGAVAQTSVCGFSIRDRVVCNRGDAIQFRECHSKSITG